MNRFIVSLPIAACLALPAAAAPFVTVDGRFGGDAVDLTDVVSATVEVTDDASAILVAVTEPSVAVTNGAFSLEVDLADATQALELGEVLTVRVVLASGDESIDALEAVGALGRLYAVDEASTAARALRADAADALDTIPAAELLNVSEVGTLSVAFGNVNGVPAGVGDGVDNGNVNTIGSGLILSGTTLDIANGSVTSAAIANSSITGAQIQDGSIRGADLQNLPSSAVANGTLVAGNFANDAFGADDTLGIQRLFKLDPGCGDTRQLTTANTCISRSCNVGGFTFTDCEGICNRSSPRGCTTTPVGHILLDP